jgi:uncharacterized protein YebE (UPF0316 family)
MVIAIIISRIADQTFTVMRTVSIVKGLPILAGLFGFLEVLVWINVAGRVLQNLDQWWLTLTYAAGFAVGNAVGIWIESKIAIGYAMVRIVSKKGIGMGRKLEALGYPVTFLEGRSRGEDVEIVMLADRRKSVTSLSRAVEEIDSEAFVTISDVKQVGLRKKQQHS